MSRGFTVPWRKSCPGVLLSLVNKGKQKLWTEVYVDIESSRTWVNNSKVASAGMEVGIVAGLGTTGWLRITKALIFHKSWANLRFVFLVHQISPLSLLVTCLCYRVSWLVLRHLAPLRRGQQGRCHPQLPKQVDIGELLGTPDWFCFYFLLVQLLSLLTSLEQEAHSLEGTWERSSNSVEVPSAVSSVTKFLVWWCGMSKYTPSGKA